MYPRLGTPELHSSRIKLPLHGKEFIACATVYFFKYSTPMALVPNLFSVMDPFDDMAESCGPLLIKPDNVVTCKWFLLQ